MKYLTFSIFNNKLIHYISINHYTYLLSGTLFHMDRKLGKLGNIISYVYKYNIITSNYIYVLL